jgi:hypothetical protein
MRFLFRSEKVHFYVLVWARDSCHREFSSVWSNMLAAFSIFSKFRKVKALTA